MKRGLTLAEKRWADGRWISSRPCGLVGQVREWTRNLAEADRLLPGSTVTVGPSRYVIPAERGPFLLCLCVPRGRFCRAIERPAQHKPFLSGSTALSRVRYCCSPRQRRQKLDAESGFTKLLDLCKCTDRGSMGIEHKDWLLSTL
ncbi:unnamed protein product [Microthlaspi erraticum]|uniref:Uncharacterized protein n=1 Tax=Microthlaspi erraticum TaxID=1685480 RepID=A0A6D2K3A8_9BRAS|nr:unnamed protein product [Microthlaspi erraticum]